tara:strand:+ start:280 stop:840 length:561 start_codon:yes stop_codon:yes gene_type:complete
MVNYKGTKTSWGLIAKLFHWSIAFLLFWQVATGISLHNMEFSPVKIGIIGTHKFFGTLVFTLVVLRLLWRFFNTHPKYKNIPTHHKIVSSLIHFALYFLVIFIPIQGTYMTWVGGGDVYILGLVKIPALVEMDFFLYDSALTIHYYSAILLTALFSVHILAALYHRFWISDTYGVWERMAFKNKKV